MIESWSYIYDGDGVRVGEAYFVGTTLTLTKSYAFGGAYETHSDGVIRKYYSIAGQTISMRAYDPGTSSWSLSYFLTDHLGSIVTVLDDSGEVLSEQRYLPFGQVRTDVGTIAETDFGYTFQRENSYIKLLDYDARFYSPYLKHFTQPDTIVSNPGNPQSWNRYSYVVNQPMSFTDPTGHMFINDGTGGWKPQSVRYSVGEDEASEIFDDMADEKDIPFAYPRDGCYDRAADMAERIASRYGIAETHIKKFFIYGDLVIRTEYIYPGENAEEITWKWHVAPAILVSRSDGSVFWGIVDPSLMDDVAPLWEWRDTMNDPVPLLDLRNMDAYWPVGMTQTVYGPDFEYENVATGKLRGGLIVDGYLDQCIDAGYCQP